MKRALFIVVPLAAVVALMHWYGTEPTDATTRMFPLGKRIVYALEWSSTADTGAPRINSGDGLAPTSAKHVGADLRVKGEWVVRRVASEAGQLRLCAGFAALSQRRAEVLGQDLTADAANADGIFYGHEGCFELDGRGRVERFLFNADSPVLFQQFVQGVAEATQYTSRPEGASAWDGEESSTLGTAISHYRYEPTAASAVTWTRDAYRQFTGLPPWARGVQPSVDGQGAIAFDDEPGFKTLDGAEAVTVPDTAGGTVYAYRKKISLQRLRIEDDKGEARVAMNLRSYPIGRPIGIETARQAAEERAAATSSLAQIRGTVLAYNGGQVPGEQMLGMAAFLRRNPEACAELGRLLRQADMDLTKRSLLVDLLVAAATPEAQQALREALSSPELAGNEEARMMGLQRFAMLRTPTAESAAFLRAEFAAAEKRGAQSSRNAALISLGSVAGHMINDPSQRDTVAAAVRTIHEALNTADSSANRVAALVALGGTHDPAQVDALSRYAGDSDPQVRAGVAAGLGYLRSEASNGALFQLATDQEAMVARMALQPLGKRELNPAERLQLETLLVNNGTNASVDTQLAVVVARQADADPDAVRRMLNTLLARQDPGSELAQGIRRMLETLNAG